MSDMQAERPQVREAKGRTTAIEEERRSYPEAVTSKQSNRLDVKLETTVDFYCAILTKGWSSNCTWRVRLVAKDTALSRRRSRVRIPYALPGKPVSLGVCSRRVIQVAATLFGDVAPAVNRRGIVSAGASKAG